MRQEIHALVFPRPSFSSAEAKAWASLHGFDHAVAKAAGDELVVEHQPRWLFEPHTFREIEIDPRSGVRAITGRMVRREEPLSARLSYLRTNAQRTTYERYSDLLRRRALLGLSRIGPDVPRANRNQDLSRWYLQWYVRTHPGTAAEEERTAYAIVRGLGQATRDHALDFVRKLGYEGD